MNKKLCVIDPPMSAVENLARNEACYEAVKAHSFAEIVRFYSFKQRGVILSKHQHPDDVHEFAWQNQEVTRRKTGGGAVVVDEHTLGYSIFGFLDGVDGSKDNPIHIPYQRMRSAVIAALSNFGLEPKEEEHWGIRVGDGVIAGHAQRFENGAYEVHGLLRLKKWDMDEVAKALKLRQQVEVSGARYLVAQDGVYTMERERVVLTKRPRVLRDESAELAKAPGLEDSGVSRSVLIEKLQEAFAAGPRSELPSELVSRAKIHEREYASREYAKRGLESKRYLGHCFVNLEDK